MAILICTKSIFFLDYGKERVLCIYVEELYIGKILHLSCDFYRPCGKGLIRPWNVRMTFSFENRCKSIVAKFFQNFEDDNHYYTF
jgi:hypothetical protein